jgi:hypothetical protein
MAQKHTGGCLCGEIRYHIARPLRELRECHCTHCQKASGTGGSVNVIVPSASVTFLKGTPKRYVDTAQSGNTLFRHFCGTCGSPIYSQRETRPDVMVFRAGTLDDSSDLRIVAHIWTASARPWSHIGPDVETHPGNAPPKA